MRLSPARTTSSTGRRPIGCRTSSSNSAKRRSATWQNRQACEGGIAPATARCRSNWPGIFCPANTAASGEKIVEFVWALKMEFHLENDEILEFYANRVYLGNRNYGVETASRHYFGKHAKDLSLGEAVLLAAAIKKPSRWNYSDDRAGAERARPVDSGTHEAAGLRAGRRSLRRPVPPAPRRGPPQQTLSRASVDVDRAPTRGRPFAAGPTGNTRSSRPWTPRRTSTPGPNWKRKSGAGRKKANTGRPGRGRRHAPRRKGSRHGGRRRRRSEIARHQPGEADGKSLFASAGLGVQAVPLPGGARARTEAGPSSSTPARSASRSPAASATSRPTMTARCTGARFQCATAS